MQETFVVAEWFIPLVIWNDQDTRSRVVMILPLIGAELASSVQLDIE